MAMIVNVAGRFSPVRFKGCKVSIGSLQFTSQFQRPTTLFLDSQTTGLFAMILSVKSTNNDGSVVDAVETSLTSSLSHGSIS